MARKGDYAGALLERRKAVELDPEDGKACYHLAFALDQQVQLEEAIPQFERAVEPSSGQEPRSPEMLAAMYSFSCTPCLSVSVV